MVVQSYHDLCKEIELLELRVKDLKREHNFYMGFISKKPEGIRVSTMQEDRVQSSHPYMKADEAYKKCVEINELLMQYDELITDKLSTKEKIEQGMSDFDTLEGKINYLFHIKNKKLYEIADDLGYSYDWIREVKNRHDKKMKNPQYTHNFSK